MPCDSRTLKRWRAAVGLVGALQVSPAVAAEPAKEVSVRRGYDFTRPEPDAILPNPTEGVGTPPQLREYVTVHAMTNETSQTGSGKVKGRSAATMNSPLDPSSAGHGTTTPASQPAAAPPEQSAGAGAPVGGGASPAAAARAAKPLPPADYVRKLLAEQVAARGISGPFTYRPSDLAKADASSAAEEQSLWNGSVARLASSWQTWQTRHRPATEPGAVEAGRSAASPGRSVETAPGRIVLSGAPPGVTGDLPDAAP